MLNRFTFVGACPAGDRLQGKLLQVLILLLLATIICTPITGHTADKERDSAIVLMYHHFGDDRYPSTNILVDQFESHIEFLQQEGFQVWPLEKIVEHIQTKQSFPDKTIAITMDDAYKTVYTEAYPRLKALGWPFTVFVSTDYIDKKYSNYMSWDQMREMQAHGASFGNHSRSHEYLIRHHKGETKEQWQQRMHDDLSHAQKRLEEELQEPLALFAYPYGEYNLNLANIVAELGLIAFGQQSGPVGHHADMRFLPRFPVNEAYGDLRAGLKTKLLSLALPVTEMEPLDSVTTEEIPILKLTIAPSKARLNQLACFASGQGKINIEWLDKEKNQLQVSANKPLPKGRTRYNCTAPSNEPGRYFWFSQPWLKK